MKTRNLLAALGGAVALIAIGLAAFLIWLSPATSKDAPTPVSRQDSAASRPASPATPTTSDGRDVEPQPRPAASDPAAAPASIPRPLTAPAAPSAAPAAAANPDPAVEKPVAVADNFFDPVYGVTGKIPEGWTMRHASRWGNQENTLWFRDPENPRASPSFYYRIFDQPMELAGGEVEAWLRQEALKKAEQRINGGLSDYNNRDMSLREINGRPALTWTAEYTRNNQPWAEYLTRIYTPHGTLLFFMHAPAEDLPNVIPKFESMIHTTTMP